MATVNLSVGRSADVAALKLHAALDPFAKSSVSMYRALDPSVLDAPVREAINAAPA